MTRALDTITRSLIGKLHVGWAFGKRGGVLDTLLGAAAITIQDAEQSAELLMDEIDPRNARALLPDFERVLGPDPCGRDLNDPDVPARQRLAYQRWVARGGQSIPYMVGVAANLGVEIEIEEFWPSKAGGFRCGRPLIPDGEQFVYRVKLEGGRVTKFRAGLNSTGHRLGTVELSPIECELRRIKPAHTTIVFAYHELLFWGEEQLVYDGEALSWGVVLD
jgi:uncharacterized protein YmfQ (DUF2313 family)